MVRRVWTGTNCAASVTVFAATSGRGRLSPKRSTRSEDARRRRERRPARRLHHLRQMQAVLGAAPCLRSCRPAARAEGDAAMNRMLFDPLIQALVNRLPEPGAN